MFAKNLCIINTITKLWWALLSQRNCYLLNNAITKTFFVAFIVFIFFALFAYTFTKGI